MADYYVELKELAVGYRGEPLIRDINIGIEKGKIVTLIGPNGAGKSTILKSITRQLKTISGSVYVEMKNYRKCPTKIWQQRLQWY